MPLSGLLTKLCPGPRVLWMLWGIQMLNFHSIRTHLLMAEGSNRKLASSFWKFMDISFRYDIVSSWLWNKLPASFLQPNPGHSSSRSSHPSHLSSFLLSSPLSPFITPSLLHSKLNTFSSSSHHRFHPSIGLPSRETAPKMWILKRLRKTGSESAGSVCEGVCVCVVDIIECHIQRDICEPNGLVCNNTIGSYRCTCKPGYENINASNNCTGKARFPLPELTTRVNGPSWRVTGFHYPSTRPVLTGNGNRSPINSCR